MISVNQYNRFMNLVSISNYITLVKNIISIIFSWCKLRPIVSTFFSLFLSLLVWGIWPQKNSNYEFESITRGDVEETITAVGSLTPFRTVKVGAETSGLVSQVLVDVNQRVEKGQLLAVIETDRLAASVQQFQSSLAAARSEILQAEAQVARRAAETRRARLELVRIRALSDRGFVTQRSLELAETEAARETAEERSAVAKVESAKAQLSRAAAQLADAKTTLSRSRIIAPISGIVVSRQVDPGQTLAANFQAPVLFEIVDDITNMMVRAEISEADIAAVANQQSARVTIEALGGRIVNGRVQQIRPQPVLSNGTVSYEVIIGVDQVSARILPGMTATVDIIVARAKSAIRVPVAALNFRPPALDVSYVPVIESFNISVAPSKGGGPPVQAKSEVRRSFEPDDGTPAVWRIDSSASRGLIRVPVQLGIQGDSMVEVRSADLQIGDKIAVGIGR